MPMPAWPVDGGCRCGRVRFRISDAPLMELACHCKGCQRMTASAFSTTLALRASAFSILVGETVVGGCHGEDGEHHHCDWCKSWIFTRARAVPGSVYVRATLLDDASWFAPWAETQTAEKLPWASTGASRSFERFPGFEALIPEYRMERRID